MYLKGVPIRTWVVCEYRKVRTQRIPSETSTPSPNHDLSLSILLPTPTLPVRGKQSCLVKVKSTLSTSPDFARAILSPVMGSCFTLFGRQRQRNAQRLITHVHSYCSAH